MFLHHGAIQGVPDAHKQPHFSRQRHHLHGYRVKSHNLQPLLYSNTQRRGSDFRHFQLKHCRQLGVTPSFECRQCQYGFSTSIELTFHSKYSHQTTSNGSKQFCFGGFCEVCEVDVPRVKKHISKLHNQPGTCHLCGHSVANANMLLRHVRRHGIDYVKTLPNPKTLNESADSKKPVFKCQYCDQEFLSTWIRGYHIKFKHENKLKLKCDLCGCRFSSAKGLRCHKKAVHPKEKICNDAKGTTVLFQCDQCDFSTNAAVNKVSHVNQHLIDKHKHATLCDGGSEGESVYKCNICSTGVPSRHELLKHFRAHHDKELGLEKLFKCNHCVETFLGEYTRKVHEKRMHQHPTNETIGVPKRATLDLPVKCHYCDMRFASIYKKSGHLKLKHENKFRVKCELCGGRFSTPGILRTHKRNVHEDNNFGANVETSFTCEECGFQTNSDEKKKRHVEQHMLEKHTTPSEDVDEALLNCNLCLTGAPSRIEMVKHLRSEHSDQLGIEPLFKCNYCDETFFKATLRQMHERKIHVVAPFRNCRACQSVFPSFQELLAHQEEAHEFRTPIKCPICHLEFPLWEDLLTHCRKTHAGSEIKWKELKYSLLKPSVRHLKGQSQVEPKWDNVEYFRQSKNLPISCSICLDVFKTERMLRMHTKTYHPTPKGNKIRKSKPDVKVEKDTCVTTKSFWFECPCTGCDFTTDKSYQKYPHLNEHVLDKHLLPNWRVKKMWSRCDTCSFTLAKSREKLLTHMKNAHDQTEGLEPLIKCQFCDDKLFEGELSSHGKRFHASLVSGTNSKFPCMECGKMYRKMERLLAHQMTVHGMKPGLKCSICPEQFNFESHLQQHCDTVHGVGVGEVEIKMESDASVQRKLRGITIAQLMVAGKCQGRVTGVCELCNTRYRDMRKHILAKHRAYEYVCDKCGIEVIGTGLYKHLRLCLGNQGGIPTKIKKENT